MSIPTTTLAHLPFQTDVLLGNRFSPPWVTTLQFLYTRIGGSTAPSNTQLATAITDAEATFVKGPASSVDSDVAVFNGTSGLVIKDTGVPLSSLAPLNSPAFSGTPTAPTATFGANSGQIASTAFVQSALRITPLPLVDAATILVDATQNNSFSVTLGGNRTLGAPSGLANGMLLNFAIKQDGTGSRTLAFNAIYDFGAAGTPTMSTTAGVTDYISGYYDSVSGKVLSSIRKADSTAANFSAHNNGVAQSIPNATFTKVTFSTIVFGGSLFASSAWTPPAGRTILLTGTVNMATVNGAICLATIYKNGVEFKRGTQQVPAGATFGGNSVTCIDIPNGTDVYDLRVLHVNGAAANTDGTASNTYFQGTTIQA